MPLCVIAVDTMLPRGGTAQPCATLQMNTMSPDPLKSLRPLRSKFELRVERIRQLAAKSSRAFYCGAKHLPSPCYYSNDAALLGREQLQCHELQRGGPVLSSGNPSANSVEIGKRISNRDVVNVQEDFNYHAYVYSENSHLYRTATSGGVPFGDGLNSLSTLSSGEYITSIEAYWGKYNSHTRIFYLKFTTSLGNTLSGGTTTEDKATLYASDGYQLSGFHGRDGDAIDALGAVWTKISS